MSFQQQKLLKFPFIFPYEMKFKMEANLTDYEQRPYSKLIALRKQLNVLFQLLHRLCLVMMRMNKRRNVMLLLDRGTNVTGDCDAGPNFSLSD
jgi:hypothetical protein